jgi:hypothetical protein
MLLVTSGSFMGVKEALKALSPIVSGGAIVCRLGVMNSPGMNDSKRIKEEKKVHVAARRFAAAMKKKHSFRPSFINMLWFSAFNATTSVNADNYPADFKYYEDKEFFVETKLSIFQRKIISSFTNLFIYLTKKGYV